MFYQKYLSQTKLPTSVTQMEPNKAYYLSRSLTDKDKLIVKGSNGSYELVSEQQVIYNPLIKATIEGEYDSSEDKGKITIYPIENLLSNEEVVSKIQVEFSEKNTNPLSNNAIFINADMIKGYKQTNNENKKDKDGNIIEYATNIYSFETIDDVTTKIRYLGIIGRSLNEPIKNEDGTTQEVTGEFIILNYYTTE